MKRAGLLGLLALSACATSPTSGPDLTTLFPVDPDRSAADIMRSAHAAAGGSEWSSPQTLAMEGYAVFYRGDTAVRHERHTMYRVYAVQKDDARRADGKVRIRSVREGQAVIDLAFDGDVTSTAEGPQPKSEADARWASNFGFGVIRHAFDEGYSLSRLHDDLIDGRPAYLIRITDPSGGETQFGIAQDDYAILKVGFDTDRGWHERIYSNFFQNAGRDWVQPGRVRLYYDGVKANEVIWTEHRIDADLPDCLFTLPQDDNCYGPFDRDGTAP